MSTTKKAAKATAAKATAATKTAETVTVSFDNLTPLSELYDEANSNVLTGFYGYAEAVGQIVKQLDDLRDNATKEEKAANSLYSLIGKVASDAKSSRTQSQISKLGRAVYKNSEWRDLFGRFGIRSRIQVGQYFTAKGHVKARPKQKSIEIPFVTPSGEDSVMTIRYDVPENPEDEKRLLKESFNSYLNKVQNAVKLAKAKETALKAVKSEYV